MYALFIPRMRAASSAHLTVFEMGTLRMSGEGYKLWGYSLCSFIHPAAISCLL